MSVGATILSAEALKCTLGGREILCGVDLSLGEGEIVGLLGPNGAGKTTLMRLLSGQLRAGQGRISMAGEDIGSWPAHRRALFGLGHLFQAPSVFTGLSAEKNILAVLELRPGRHKAARRDRAAELLALFGLTAQRDQAAASLSGGERRRLELARLLAAEPRVVLMDEPFAGLDPKAIADLQREIGALAARGLGVLITDHQVEQTLTICRRACILIAGTLVTSGKPDEVREHPAARGAFFGTASGARARSNSWA